ncbi:ankyrin repeat domain-containing protein SOWAHC [Ambystoma mexicanum]|uniref:ankyrin repeat domain-containing protein SOWAHC n=1 Tax=Ambystoma mexicanum TaxID=8296 RepID=UPI0037E7EC9C
MAEELCASAVLQFLQEQGGRVRNQELLDRFRGCLHPAEDEARARARQRFKDIVNELGSVRQEADGVKYVCLRKKYRQPAGDDAPTEHPAEEEREEPPTEKVASQRPAEATDHRNEEQPLPPPRISVTCAAGDAPPPPEVDKEARTRLDGSPAEEPLTGGDSPRSPRGYTGSSPVAGCRHSRETFRELLLSGASPQLRRGGFFPSRRGAEADSASLVSEESSSSLALEPREHAWMLCTAAGSSPWALLTAEPSLLTRRDFITGCSCIHWAARQGRHELLAALLAFAHRHALPVDVNARTAGGGYTALHLAAMHGHGEVAKLLIGAYDADVDIRDYSGRKAYHYLGPGAAESLRGLVRGEAEGEEVSPTASEEANAAGRWSLSRVLPSGLIVHKLSQVLEEEYGGPHGSAHRGKPVSRRSSGGARAKPRLNKMRFRTQIIHNTQPGCGGPEDEGEGLPLKSPHKLRPKSNMFG